MTLSNGRGSTAVSGMRIHAPKPQHGDMLLFSGGHCRRASLGTIEGAVSLQEGRGLSTFVSGGAVTWLLLNEFISSVILQHKVGISTFCSGRGPRGASSNDTMSTAAYRSGYSNVIESGCDPTVGALRRVPLERSSI